MKYVVSVAKTYTHRGNHRHRPDTRKHWYVYYYDEEGNFRSERVNYLQAMYYKRQKRHRVKLLCNACGQWFIGLVKSENEEVQCPYGCDSEVENEEDFD